MAKFTIKEIKKTNLDDTFLGTYFYRKTSTYLTFFLAKTSLTPNVVSFLSLFFALVSAISFSFGIYSYTVIAVLFLQIAMFLDYSDGQIARLKKLGTVRGAWLDVVLGMIQNNLVVLGMTVGLYKNNPNPYVLFASFAALFAWNMTCYVHLIAMIFFPKVELKKTAFAAKVGKGFHIKPQYLSIGSDVYFVILGLSTLFSLLYQGLIFMAILGNLYWVSVGTFMFLKNKNAV